jgi:NADPH:quinone reductase-like Zn-dependent oxidoreductase
MFAARDRGAHAALIRELGATPIDYQREDFTRVVPGGFEVAFDGIGEDDYRRPFAALKSGGLLCVYGYTRLACRRSVACSPLDVDCAPVSMEAVAELAAWRQAFPRLLDQRDAGRDIPPGSRRTWSGSSACWQPGSLSGR